MEERELAARTIFIRELAQRIYLDSLNSQGVEGTRTDDLSKMCFEAAHHFLDAAVQDEKKMREMAESVILGPKF